MNNSGNNSIARAVIFLYFIPGGGTFYFLTLFCILIGLAPVELMCFCKWFGYKYVFSVVVVHLHHANKVNLTTTSNYCLVCIVSNYWFNIYLPSLYCLCLYHSLCSLFPPFFLTLCSLFLPFFLNVQFIISIEIPLRLFDFSDNERGLDEKESEVFQWVVIVKIL